MGSRASKEIPIAIGAYLGAVFFYCCTPTQGVLTKLHNRVDNNYARTTVLITILRITNLIKIVLAFYNSYIVAVSRAFNCALW